LLPYSGMETVISSTCRDFWRLACENTVAASIEKSIKYYIITPKFEQLLQLQLKMTLRICFYPMFSLGNVGWVYDFLTDFFHVFKNFKILWLNV